MNGRGAVGRDQAKGFRTGFKRAYLDARDTTYRIPPASTTSRSIGAEASDAAAPAAPCATAGTSADRAMAIAKNTAPPQKRNRGLACAAPFQPRRVKIVGETSISRPVSTPVAVATSPIVALKLAGVGCSIRRCVFHANSMRFVDTPCAIAHSARQRICGFALTKANDSLIPICGASFASSPASFAALALSSSRSFREPIALRHTDVRRGEGRPVRREAAMSRAGVQGGRTGGCFSGEPSFERW